MFEELRAVDLTLTLDERYPTTYPPHMPFLRRTWNWFEEQENGPEVVMNLCGPYFTEVLIMDEHIGTHFDAPAHFLPEHAPGGNQPICGDDVPVEIFCGPAFVVDATRIVGEEGGVSGFITPEHIKQAERQNDRELRPGDVVLLRTDWDKRWYKPGAGGRAYTYNVVVTKESPGWPAPDVPCIEYLLDKGVKCVGIDAPSMGAAHDGVPVHISGLGAGMVYIEGLAELGSIPATGAYFQFMPIKIARSSGGPGRAVAWVPRE